MYVLPARIYEHQMSTFESQKWTLDLLELELWMTVNYYIGAGNQTQVLHKNMRS